MYEELLFFLRKDLYKKGSLKIVFEEYSHHILLQPEYIHFRLPVLHENANITPKLFSKINIKL